MPMYFIEFTKKMEWNVFARSKDDAVLAATKDIDAQRDAIYDAETEISVGYEHEMTNNTEVHAVADGDELKAPEDVRWFDQDEMVEKECAEKHERMMADRNLCLFGEESGHE